MDDLVTWLRAQLDDDEAIATVISDGGYMPQQWRHGSDSGDVGVLLYADDRMIGDPPDAIEEADAPFAIVINNRAEHRHIARWDPARALAEVDAKRQRLEWIEGELADDPANATVQWLAQLDALPYAGRPGYDESWPP